MLIHTQNEAPDLAIVREVKEELGVDGRIVSLLGVYEHTRANQVIIAYHVVASGAITIDKRELEAYKRVPIHRLKPWPMATGHAVRDFLLRRAQQGATTTPTLSSKL